MNSFSVVIPAYNAEKTIYQCLMSVANQSMLPLEVFIVDDFSLDSTRVQVESCYKIFSDLGIHLSYVRLEKNSGPSAARNFGVRYARGQYIAFLDADDFWHCDKLLIVNQAVLHSSPGLIFHSFCDDPEADLTSPISSVTFKSVDLITMLLRNPAATSCVVVKNVEMLLFNIAMRYCEDYDLWLRIAERSIVLQIICSPLTRLGRPQLTKGGLSENRIGMRLGEMRAYLGFCTRSTPWRYLLTPVLLMFSAIKHVYSLYTRMKLY